MSKRAVIYARVSTDEQTKGYSLPSQIEACQEFGLEHGYEILATFQDDYTGATLDRPGLNELREYISQHPIDAMIVLEMDRLARRSIYQMLLEEELRKVNAVVEYVIGQYDDSDEGRLQKQIRASIAEYEKAKIMERSKRGKRGKAKSGFVLVAARPPYGYTVLTEPHKSWLEIDEDEARIVRLVYRWYLYGDNDHGPLSMLGIAARLTEMGIPTRGDKEVHVAKKRPKGVWSAGMVRNILKNETYISVWHYGKTKMINDGNEASRKSTSKRGLGKQVSRKRDEWIEVEVPAIIDTLEFQKVKQRLKQNIEQSRRNTHRKYLMTSRLRCLHCGYTFTGRTRREKHTYYCCKGRDQKPYRLCEMPYFRADHVDNVVWNWIKEILEQPEILATGLRSFQAETRDANKAIYNRLELIEHQLEDHQRQLNKLLDLYLSNNFPEEILNERNNHLEATIKELEKERERLEAHLGTVAYSDKDLAAIEEFCAKIRAGLDTVTFEGKRRVLDLLNVRGTLAIENEEKVIHVTCIISPEQVSLALTSPLSSIGAIASPRRACPPTALSP